MRQTTDAGAAADRAVDRPRGTTPLDALSPRFAGARQAADDDRRLVAHHAEFASRAGYGRMRGYLARPAAATGPLPGGLVVHENRGVNPHIEDIARRPALDNSVAFAPDALFPLGGYPGDADRAREPFPKLDQAKTHADFVAAAGFLQSLPERPVRIGGLGLCYGGLVANLLATRLPELAATRPQPSQTSTRSMPPALARAT